MNAESDNRWRWWPQARAALIVVHIVGITLSSLPNPALAPRSAWQDSTVQAELARWSARLNRAGLETTPETLEHTVWEWLQKYDRVRGPVLAPFEKYHALCGTHQSWAMFAAPHLEPQRLFLEIHEDNQWRRIYRAGNGGWQAGMLDNYRIRSVVFRLGWEAWKQDREAFTRALAQAAARDFPNATALRLAFERTTTPTPQQTRDGVQPTIRIEPELVVPLRTP